MFEGAGYGVVPFALSADIYVINTCSVTEFADKKCRQLVRRALKLNPDAKVVVIGCYAQLKPKEISEIPGVDLVLGAKEKFRILDYVDQLGSTSGREIIHNSEIQEVDLFQGAFSFGDRTRSFLKVQDGCDYKCTFCTIPLARGKSRSDTVEHVIENAKKIAELGVREIVLTGVNIGDFSDSSKEEKRRFLELIKELDEIEDIGRFRISSIEPNLCSDQIIEFVSQSKKFMPHFHMPLQSGNNELLGRMRRRYRRELYADRVAVIKNLMPHACIGVDMIVGFPGETEQHFLDSYEFVSDLPVSYLHVFTYSERPNTPAIEMAGSVPMRERRKRNEILRLLSDKKKRLFYEVHLDTEREVLFEKSKAEGQLTGFTDNYLKVFIDANEASVNSISLVTLKGIGEDGNIRASRPLEVGI
jgi:threonylcarbamoyladenosine tRNA methylthiotransferase MtaB